MMKVDAYPDNVRRVVDRLDSGVRCLHPMSFVPTGPRGPFMRGACPGAASGRSGCSRGVLQQGPGPTRKSTVRKIHRKARPSWSRISSASSERSSRQVPFQRTVASKSATVSASVHDPLAIPLEPPWIPKRPWSESNLRPINRSITSPRRVQRRCSKAAWSALGRSSARLTRSASGWTMRSFAANSPITTTTRLHTRPL